VKVWIWDTTGQEILRLITRSYSRDSACAIMFTISRTKALSTKSKNPQPRAARSRGSPFSGLPEVSHAFNECFTAVYTKAKSAGVRIREEVAGPALPPQAAAERFHFSTISAMTRLSQRSILARQAALVVPIASEGSRKSRSPSSSRNIFRVTAIVGVAGHRRAVGLFTLIFSNRLELMSLYLDRQLSQVLRARAPRNRRSAARAAKP
jgi:hypothetical protein